MKRKQGKDITSYFSKEKPSECEAICNPNSVTQPTQQISSSSDNISLCHVLPIQKTELEGEATSNHRAISIYGVERLTAMDVVNLPDDPGKRRKMIRFHLDDVDIVRAEYIQRGPCQPETHVFPFRPFGKKNRRFNPKWFDKYRDWLEYSVEKDAAFCFACYLFKNDNVGSDAFVSDGFKTWSRTDAFEKHIGGYLSFHNQAMMALQDFKNQRASLVSMKRNRKVLEASVKFLKWLVPVGLFVLDESQPFGNKTQLLELFNFHATGSFNVEKVVLENAAENCPLIDPKIQKDIINACAKETARASIEELGDDDFFAILTDVFVDKYDKEQLALCLRYINKNGEVIERFLGLAHLPDNTSSALKQAIESLLMEHSLKLSRVRGHGYNGAGKMHGAIRGLKTLIMDENHSAYFVHSFAHELQKTLVAVALKNMDCYCLVGHILPLLLNFIGGSPKRIEFLREKQKTCVVEALSLGELDMENGELSSDTPWGFYSKAIMKVLYLYHPILESLDQIAEATIDISEQNRACTIITLLMSFDVVFVAHLMGSILAITNELNIALQKNEKDLVNALNMVDVVKRSLQRLRENGWDAHLNKVTSFVERYGIEIPNMEERYVSPGRRRFRDNRPHVTNLHHFRDEVFTSVIDQQLQELENMFDEKSKELLISMSCFDPVNQFSSFDKQKLLRLAKFYENEFSSAELIFFEHSLANFVEDLRTDERFRDVKNLSELSMKLVETKKHDIHPRVYLLLKLVLLLPVTRASVERFCSGMIQVKNRLRSSIGDQLLNDSLVTYLEKDVFLSINDDAIVECFLSMSTQ